MQKVLATGFDSGSWDRHGLQWMRAVKSAGCIGLVIDAGIPQQAKNTLAEVKFRVVPLVESNTGPFGVLSDNLKENERCLWCPADFDFKSADSLFSGTGLICDRDDGTLPLANMVMPIANIQKRADTANLIEKQVIPVHGSTLNTKVVCGGMEDWAGFVGYYRFLVTSSFLEVRTAFDKVAINLYAANFPGRVTTV